MRQLRQGTGSPVTIPRGDAQAVLCRDLFQRPLDTSLQHNKDAVGTVRVCAGDLGNLLAVLIIKLRGVRKS